MNPEPRHEGDYTDRQVVAARRVFVDVAQVTKAATYRDDPWEGFCEVKHLELPAELTTESPGHALYALASNYSREEYQSAPQRLFVNSWCRCDVDCCSVPDGGKICHPKGTVRARPRPLPR